MAGALLCKNKRAPQPNVEEAFCVAVIVIRAEVIVITARNEGLSGWRSADGSL